MDGGAENGFCVDLSRMEMQVERENKFRGYSLFPSPGGRGIKGEGEVSMNRGGLELAYEHGLFGAAFVVGQASRLFGGAHKRELSRPVAGRPTGQARRLSHYFAEA
jgi:hypothetical protein